MEEPDKYTQDIEKERDCYKESLLREISVRRFFFNMIESENEFQRLFNEFLHGNYKCFIKKDGFKFGRAENTEELKTEIRRLLEDVFKKRHEFESTYNLLILTEELTEDKSSEVLEVPHCPKCKSEKVCYFLDDREGKKGFQCLDCDHKWGVINIGDIRGCNC